MLLVHVVLPVREIPFCSLDHRWKELLSPSAKDTYPRCWCKSRLQWLPHHFREIKLPTAWWLELSQTSVWRPVVKRKDLDTACYSQLEHATVKDKNQKSADEKYVVYVLGIKLTGDRRRRMVHLSSDILEAGKLLFPLGNLLWDGQQAEWRSKTPSKLCTLKTLKCWQGTAAAQCSWGELWGCRSCLKVNLGTF